MLEPSKAEVRIETRSSRSITVPTGDRLPPRSIDANRVSNVSPGATRELGAEQAAPHSALPFDYVRGSSPAGAMLRSCD